METSYDHEYHDLSLESAAKLSEDLKFQLSLTKESGTQNAILEQKYDDVHDEDDEEEEAEEEEEEEEEFSFMCGGGNASPIAAEDAFVNGQIKPFFPLFNTDLLLGQLGERSQVKKVFVEVKTDDDDDEDDDGQGTIFTTTTSSSSGNDEITGPYCEWSKESPAPEVCKKSNSTGFSKLWRFRDLLHRSNSDGRDAFVFLNSQPTTSSVEKKEEKKAGRQEVKVKVNDGKGKVKKAGKGKPTKKSLSPHEIYMRSKAKEDDRRRSYLPYRPEVFGFFTNVNGGMSRNVHPF